MSKPSKTSSLDKLRSKARHTQPTPVKDPDSEYGDVFDTLWASGPTKMQLTPTSAPAAVEPNPTIGQTTVEREILPGPDPVIPQTDQVSAIAAPNRIGKNVPTTVSENIFAQFRVAYNEHKFFAFLIEYGTVLQEQAITQTQIASLLGLRVGTFKQLAGRMKDAGIISAESAAWHKKGVTYKANEPYIEQFHAIYHGKFPKTKKAFKTFHEARIEAEFKRS